MSKVSEANIAANRANAKLSTGPRTPEGKARSSQNARKHIFNATAFPVVRLEEIDEVDRLRADAIAAYKPANSQETFAVERIVLAQQALLRAERLHSGMMTICLNQTVTDDGRPFTAISPILVNDDYQICRAQNRNYLLAEGFNRLFTKSPAFTQFLRYQAQAERLYRRAIEEFDRLRKLRDELTNEPENTSQPAESEPLAEEETNPDASPAAQPPHPPEHYGPDGELLPHFARIPRPLLDPDPPPAVEGVEDREAREARQ
jgi:hypothetical protein